MAILLTGAQMRAIDKAIVDKLGLPSLVLMENAGRGATDVIARLRPDLRGLDVRIVCGAGQNGGDGFVVARHLLGKGAAVQVLLAMPAEKISGDAAVFARVLRTLAADAVHDFSAEADPSRWQARLRGADIIVDALLGTGLRSDVAGVPAAAIAGMNATDAVRVALDIPSGIDADTGAVHGIAVHAHATATMGCRKLGLVLDADATVGQVEVVDLGVALASVLSAASESGPLCYWLERGDIAASIPVRGQTGHKGTAGHLLVIAGAKGKTGAALLAGRAALRAGAGLLTLATTAGAQSALDAKAVCEMTSCYAQGDDADDSSFATLMAQVARMKAIAIGPGIPTGQGMAGLVQQLVAEVEVPMVVDADALNLLGSQAAAIAFKAPAPRIFTPHPGEMARLCGCTISEVQKDRLGLARRLAANAGAVVVLKGARTIIATPDGTAYVNPTANASLGTAGSGDVLTGVIGGFLAQGLAAKDAACVGVFVHGTAADVAIRTLGSRRLIATDLHDAIARACDELSVV